MTDTFNLLPMNHQLSSSFGPLGSAEDDNSNMNNSSSLLLPPSSFAKNQKKKKKQPYVSPSMQGYQQKMKMAQSIRNGGICYGSGQNVGRMPLKQLLLPQENNHNSFVDSIPMKFQVPIFQRRYCWTETQWQTLLMDAATTNTTTTSSDGFHSLGRLTCTNSLSIMPNNTSPEQEEEKVAHDDDDAVVPNKAARRSIILDGQQRFTTVTLLLAAIRDALWKRQQFALARKNNLPNALDPAKASQLIQEIDQILFPNYEEYQQWLNDAPQLEEGMELQFAKLIPTYCDRWSYYSAILPKQHATHVQNRLTLSSQHDQDAASFHRPLAAKTYYDAILCTFSNGEVLKLLDGIYHKLTMLVFPIEFKGRTDGTEDLMVVYERLAIRDATWCPPTRSDEYVTMSGLDMIRNALLGNFSSETKALDFYQTYWLPMERMAAAATTTTSGEQEDQDLHQQKEEERNMQSMMQAFLDQQENLDKEEEEKIEEGTVGGMLYVRFQLWQDRCMNTTEIMTDAEQATRNQGEAMLTFAKGYFQSSSSLSS